MAKKAYVGVNNVARQAKKIYVGVNNVARKVKKGYIGVNNVARLFFSGTLKLVFNKSALSSGYYSKSTGAYNGKYGFISGSDMNGHTNDIVAIDDAFVRTTLTASTYRAFQAAQIDPYAIFMNYGFTGFEYYNQSLTHGTLTISGITSGYGFHALYNDAYAILFPQSSGYGYPNKLFLIDHALTVTPVDVSGLSSMYHTNRPCCTNNGDYALILGGEKSSGGSNTNYFYADVNAVDKQGTITFLSDLPNDLSRAMGVRAGNYALCAGGEQGDNGSVCQKTKTVYAYNQSLTRSIASALSLYANTWVWDQNSTASAGEYGVIAVYNQTGSSGNYTYTYKYNAYSGDLVQQTFTTDKIRLAATSVGPGAVFSSNSNSNAWDTFSLE